MRLIQVTFCWTLAETCVKSYVHAAVEGSFYTNRGTVMLVNLVYYVELTKTTRVGFRSATNGKRSDTTYVCDLVKIELKGLWFLKVEYNVNPWSSHTCLIVKCQKKIMHRKNHPQFSCPSGPNGRLKGMLSHPKIIFPQKHEHFHIPQNPFWHSMKSWLVHRSPEFMTWTYNPYIPG